MQEKIKMGMEYLVRKQEDFFFKKRSRGSGDREANWRLARVSQLEH